MKKIMIIDGNSLLNRAFFALPPLTNKDGVPTNAIHGFLSMIYKMFETYEPEYMTVAFDLKGPTFRHIAYDQYKGTRKGMPEELRVQVPILKEILDALNIHRMELEGFEADDLIGTVSKRCGERGLKVLIVTGDKDALQLVDDQIEVLITKKGISQIETYDADAILKEYSLTPLQLIDFKGLSGDTSDNIPGIPGVGPKTAIKLLETYKSVEAVVQNFEDIENKRLRGLVETYANQALMSKSLARIETNVPLEFEVDEFALREPKLEAARALFSLYELKSLMGRLKTESDHVDSASPAMDSEDVSWIEDSTALRDLMDEAARSGQAAIYSLIEKIHVRDLRFRGVGVALKDRACFIPEEEGKNLASEFLMTMGPRGDIEKWSYDLKREYLLSYQLDYVLENGCMDIAIARYLIDPSRTNERLSAMAFERLKMNIPDDESVFGKGAKSVALFEVELHQAAKLAQSNARAIFDLAVQMREEISSENMTQLFHEVEMPLVEVLASMEYEGFNVDLKEIEDMDLLITAKLGQLEAEIYELAGGPFNIQSPKQLGEILFDRLGLPTQKKTKTGYSTSHDVLEKLEKHHPIIALIMEYRTYSKLKSTYIDGLRQVINPETGRIHSSLNQTVAITGRLSSTEPNLQNIPVRLPLGRRLRKVFLPSADHILVDADYSQIELRILAHFAKDAQLIHAFKNNLDIHTQTAAQVFDLKPEEVTSLERSRAKEVNFGIVYGMSDYGLSENLGITRKEARLYIDQYFAKYPNVKKYLDETIEQCRTHGYVTTILNRKRYIPDIHSKNFNLRSFAERTAMNTPIQGSAADIIKIAMVKVYQDLKKGGYKSRLILQVHDELLIDCVPEELEAVKALLKSDMESAVQLEVPIEVDMNSGSNWYETK
ncbi:DNA polymerase I [Acidaminobacter sp.]|uniref:DNA polymerase I n=1 Tax=Acidaminobacter sp. TaxID=1872102 RepID=UPI0025697F0B|nr:DNA polymerase I [Acidaminobacter sp.]MDK9709802.1 DNA polymerase I [Acidaminobacter sp.]